MDLLLNNQTKVVALAIRVSYSVLPNGLILELYNSYFVLVSHIDSILFSIKWI